MVSRAASNRDEYPCCSPAHSFVKFKRNHTAPPAPGTDRLERKIHSDITDLPTPTCPLRRHGKKATWSIQDNVPEAPQRRIIVLTQASNVSEPVSVRRVTTDPLAAIVAGCRLGDRTSQRLLYEQCKDRLYRLVARLVGPQDAADLLQQVFLRIYSKIDQFSGAASFETWAYRVAINECLQFRRTRARGHCEMPSDEPVDPSVPHTARAQHRELMERALSQIAPELRTIFVLREIDGLSYREIAATLQIEPGTVGSRLNQARAQLRARLVELGWDGSA